MPLRIIQMIMKPLVLVRGVSISRLLSIDWFDGRPLIDGGESGHPVDVIYRVLYHTRTAYPFRLYGNDAEENVTLMSRPNDPRQEIDRSVVDECECEVSHIQEIHSEWNTMRNSY